MATLAPVCFSYWEARSVKTNWRSAAAATRRVWAWAGEERKTKKKRRSAFAARTRETEIGARRRSIIRVNRERPLQRRLGLRLGLCIGVRRGGSSLRWI